MLPLRLPAGVALEGAGHDRCIIDGAGQFEPSFDPIRSETAVVVLDDGARINGVTVTNGGAHGVSALPGATVALHDCTVSRHGGHGLFLSGVTEAMVTGCRFHDNGLKRFAPVCPSGITASQGHHIFATTGSGHRGRLVISDNTLRGCFADGIAVVCLFAEADGATWAATVLRNVIEDCGRAGLLFSASFGPAGNRCRIVAAENVLRRNGQWGIGLLTAVPLAGTAPRDNVVHAVFAANEIAGSPVGVLARGAASDAHGNVTQLIVDRNRISACPTNAVRLVGAMGAPAGEVTDNTLQAVVSRNRIAGGAPAVLVQGAGGTGPARRNAVRVRFVQNDIDASAGSAIVVSDGAATNHVEVAEGSQPVTRAEGDCLG